MNEYRLFVLAILLGFWWLDVLVEWLNLRHGEAGPPPELADLCSPAQYARSRRYLRERSLLHLARQSVETLALLAAMLGGGFEWLDGLARRWAAGEIGRGLAFVGGLGLAAVLLRLPFSLWSTFGIEERYGFNRTTPRTFALDWLKGLGLGAVLGALAFAAVLAFFLAAGAWAWVWAWLALALLQLLLVWLAPAFLLPLFNKFTPLPPGELRERLESYAREQQFALQGVFTMDGSRRSTKANAFFTGFGRFRRIVLFDTLLAKYSVAELLAILAHEMGHCKLGHVRCLIVLQLAGQALLFWFLSLFLLNPGVFAAFGMSQPPSVYASLVFVSFLYAPVSLLLGLAGNALARHYEFAADAYAARTCGGAAALAAALRKLCVDDLGNLDPHPLKVWLDYDHPPLAARLRALPAAAPGPVNA